MFVPFKLLDHFCHYPSKESSILLKGVSWLYARLHFAILGQFTCWNALITRMMSTFSVNRQSWIQDLRNFNFSQKEADIGH